MRNLGTTASLTLILRAAHCIALSIPYSVFEWLPLRCNARPHILYDAVMQCAFGSVLLPVNIWGSGGDSELVNYCIS